ncbi:pseudouridine synthase [Aquirhabdus parva]|uniref:Pseudouridine synthase n=1 Tax=Aquirhabdus parva TaxID=2283318 RepID=A0A345PBE8_9GAMM|nr:pseudouridine synthase [Aquirhabdus parva]AXI04607.1 pseudouridine synthase [Aquirhabdus parva]
MQLEKIIQSQGFGSRKQCRLLIESGKVNVENTPCFDPKANFPIDHFEFSVMGKTWQYREKVYIAINKPQGFECSHTPQHHRSVFSLFPPQLIERGLQCVGRLDQDTTGLLLLTDDGAYLHALTHPRRHVPKRYRVTTSEPITPEQIAQLQSGVELMGEKSLLLADHCELEDSHILSLTIHQGIYHQVKRMIAAVGNHVIALHREQIGQFKLTDVEEGQWIYLDLLQQQAAKQILDPNSV